MTHEWLTRILERLSTDSYALWQVLGSTCSTPEHREALVWPNDNHLCVLCGHTGFTETHFSENRDGKAVLQVLFNVQHLHNGENGIAQIWQF